MRATVCIIQHRLLHYRHTLFERLRLACAEKGIALRVVYGQPSREEAKKQDTSSLRWGDEVRNRWLRFSGTDLLWQAWPKDLLKVDLVVLMQESRLLSNYPWLLSKRRHQTRVAYWGHGRNLQSAAPAGWRERWKRWWLCRVDWWFAYTEATRHLLEADGFPPGRITVLDNAIDNEAFESELAAVTDAEVRAARNQIGAMAGAPVGLYCGSLWADKRLQLLVDSCDLIVRVRPEFRLVVLGDGPAAAILKDAARTRPWLHWLGARRGAEKAAWFRSSTAFLSPGAVGLHILDAFCAGLPIVTTEDARHGPEIAYLRNGVNGIAVPSRQDAYADACLELFADPARRAAICSAAHASAARYTLDHMVSNFVCGIERALSAPPLR